MKKVVRLTESDLTRIIKKIIIEDRNRRLINESLDESVWTKMWNAFPKQPEGVDPFFEKIIPKKLVSMRKVMPTSWANTCASRMSMALLGAGLKPGGNYTTEKTVNFGGQDVPAGSNFNPSSQAFNNILERNFGEPTIINHPGGGVPEEMKNKKGVYAFKTDAWGDAAGHTDIWDGTKSGGGDHWDVPSEIRFWSVPTKVERNSVNCGWGNDTEGYKNSSWRCYDDPSKKSPAKSALECGWGKDVKAYRESNWKCKK